MQVEENINHSVCGLKSQILILNSTFPQFMNTKMNTKNTVSNNFMRTGIFLLVL